jgi:hypothetical protein
MSPVRGCPLQHVVDFAEHAAIDGMDQPVALASARVLQECGGENRFAGRSEHQLHGIIHATRHHGFHKTLARMSAKHVRGASHQGGSVGDFIGLAGKRSLAPVDPAVGTQIRTVQVIGTARQRLAVKPLFTRVGRAVAIAVRQFPDTGRSGHVQ